VSKELIVGFLKSNPSSSAREIAKSLNLDKGEINSILYSGANVEFSKIDGAPPRWKTFKKTVSKSDLIREYLHLRNDSTFTIDSHGLVWNVRVVIRSQSRNDPFFGVERVSPTERIISISDALIHEQEIVDGMTLPDSVLAIAASAIAWEISVSERKSEGGEFDFGVAMTDVFISLASQNAT
jgi:hypothetical protein